MKKWHNNRVDTYASKPRRFALRPTRDGHA